MTNPAGKDIYDASAPLTDILTAYFQEDDDFVSHKVFPNVVVPRQEGIYYEISKSDFFRDGAQLRESGTPVATGDYDVTSSTYACKRYDYGKLVNLEDKKNVQSPLDLKKQAMLYLSMKLKIKREVLWNKKYFSTGLWTTDVEGNGVNFTSWSESTATPVKDVMDWKRTIKQLTGFKPNKIVFTSDVWDAFRTHANVTSMLSSNSVKIIDRATAAKLLELDEVLVSESIYNTAASGAVDALSFIQGTEKALLVYAAPRPMIMMPTAGYTFNWSLFASNNFGIAAKKMWYDQKTEVDTYEAAMTIDQKLVSADMGVHAYNILT